jgi:hypothetical protein
MSTLVSPGSLKGPIPIHSQLTLGRGRAFRAWLNEPAKHEPTPIAGYMYGLVLRPASGAIGR